MSEIVTHRDGLTHALTAMRILVDDSQMRDVEAAIRAYIEARGLVLVPKSPTREMWEAAIMSEDGRAYQDMIEAAPDPFEHDAP